MKQLIKVRIIFITLVTSIIATSASTQEYQHIYNLANHTQVATSNTICENERMAFTGILKSNTQGEEQPFDQIYVIKTEVDGSKVWEKTYKVDNWDLYPNSIEYTDDGGFIIGGFASSSSGNISKGILLKIDGNGNQTWLESYENAYTGIQLYNYTGNQWIEHVEQNQHGEYIAISLSHLSNKQAINVMIVDGSGQVVKNRAYEYTDFPQEMTIRATDTDHYIAVASCTEFSYVMNFDSDLNMVWQKKVSINGSSAYIWARDVAMVNSNEFVITGGSTTEAIFSGYPNPNYVTTYFAFLIKMDMGGNKQWEKSYKWFNYESDVMAMSIDKDDGGNLFISGSVQYATLTGYDQWGDPTFDYDNQAFVLKANESGGAYWVSDYGKPNTYENSLDIAVHRSGEFVSVGHRNIGNYETYVVKGNPDGDTPCDMDHKYPNDSTLNYQITSQTSSALYNIVSFQSHPDRSNNFTNPGIDCQNQPVSIIAPEIDFKELNNKIKKFNNLGSFVYPNPSNGDFAIQIEKTSFTNPSEITIFQLNGKLVRRLKAIKEHTYITGIPKGAYLAQIVQGEKVITRKLIIQ